MAIFRTRKRETVERFYGNPALGSWEDQSRQLEEILDEEGSLEEILDEVRALEAANRADRDIQTERRIRWLRFMAAARLLQDPPSQAQFVEAESDPLPQSAGGLPEFSCSRI